MEIPHEAVDPHSLTLTSPFFSKAHFWSRLSPASGEEVRGFGCSPSYRQGWGAGVVSVSICSVWLSGSTKVLTPVLGLSSLFSALVPMKVSDAKAQTMDSFGTPGWLSRLGFDSQVFSSGHDLGVVDLGLTLSSVLSGSLLG